MPTVREATLRLLRDFGITTIFGNPGSTELPLFRDFPDDFRYILGLQESVVLGMADAFALAGRNAAIVNLHSSAGTGHALGNLFTAYKNQSPVIVTAGQQARSILPFEPFLHAERPTEFPRPFVKWAIEPARAADVPMAIARAYYEAMTPPCGPVFVSVPVDDWDAECDWVDVRRIATINPGDQSAIDMLAAALARARKPAFILGAGTARDEAWTALIALAEQHRAATYAAPYASRNVFPEDHVLFQGFLPAFREPLRAMLAEHDLVVAFGGPLNLYHAEGFGPHVPEGTECWSIGDNPGSLAWAPAGSAILGNTRLITERLLARSAAANRPMPPPRAAAPALDETRLCDRRAMERIAKAMPVDAIVVEEAPTSRPALQTYLKFNCPDAFFTTASGGLGYGMPAAVGIALANPGRRIVAIIGDGSAMYGIQALFSAFQLDASITFLIVNNQKYRALQDFGPTFSMEHVVGTDLSGLDFCALAKGQGITDNCKVDDADALDEALLHAFAQSGPNLIEILVS